MDLQALYPPSFAVGKRIFVPAATVPAANVYEFPSCVIVFPSFNEIFPERAENGIEDGAVKYHICFPSRFDFWNSVDAAVGVVVEGRGRGLKFGGSFVGSCARGLDMNFRGSEGFFLALHVRQEPIE